MLQFYGVFLHNKNHNLGFERCVRIYFSTQTQKQRRITNTKTEKNHKEKWKKNHKERKTQIKNDKDTEHREDMYKIPQNIEFLVLYPGFDLQNRCIPEYRTSPLFRFPLSKTHSVRNKVGNISTEEHRNQKWRQKEHKDTNREENSSYIETKKERKIKRAVIERANFGFDLVPNSMGLYWSQQGADASQWLRKREGERERERERECRQ